MDCCVCKLVRALGIKKSRLNTPYSQGESQFATLTFSSLAEKEDFVGFGVFELESSSLIKVYAFSHENLCICKNLMLKLEYFKTCS